MSMSMSILKIIMNDVNLSTIMNKIIEYDRIFRGDRSVPMSGMTIF